MWFILHCCYKVTSTAKPTTLASFQQQNLQDIVIQQSRWCQSLFTSQAGDTCMYVTHPAKVQLLSLRNFVQNSCCVQLACAYVVHCLYLTATIALVESVVAWKCEYPSCSLTKGREAGREYLIGSTERSKTATRRGL